MRLVSKSGIARLLALVLVLTMGASLFTGCGEKFEQTDTLIIDAKDLQGYVGQAGVVIVDTRSEEDYAAGHVQGAVNVPNSEIVINVPVDNMLTSAKKFTKVMQAAGISDDTLVVAYDSNKMTASRLAWSLFMYGHQNVKVVSGGIDAIGAAGLAMSTETPAVTPGSFTAAKDEKWLATKEDVLAQVNDPQDNVVLLDVRSDEEYYEEGKVPGSVMMNYLTNFYDVDGTFKNTQTTQINYIEAGITPDKEIIIYCKTSMRAAPVFVRLYDAGYRNLKIYGGAWSEWSTTGSPIEMAAGAAAPTNKDAS